jgi:hypothetical protein
VLIGVFALAARGAVPLNLLVDSASFQHNVDMITGTLPSPEARPPLEEWSSLPPDQKSNRIIA